MIVFRYALILLAAVILAACVESLAPAPTPRVAPVTPEPVAKLAPANPARGRQLFLDKQCAACHGPTGEGGIGGQLAGTSAPFNDFLHVVRTAVPPKPAFDEIELTTQDVYNMYDWLQGLDQASLPTAAAIPALESGQVLGMTLWTEGKCDTCHGAFAQGSAQAPQLAGVNYPFEMERAKMRRTAATIPEHAASHMSDELLQRLYKWLQAGANPGDGC